MTRSSPLVLEVDIDVGRLAPLAGDEAREQQVVVGLGGVDGGDPQAEADHRIGGRAAPLAEDVLVPGPPNDVVDGEEVVRITQLLDQGQFVPQRRLDLLRRAARIAPRPRPPRPGR